MKETDYKTVWKGIFCISYVNVQNIYELISELYFLVYFSNLHRGYIYSYQLVKSQVDKSEMKDHNHPSGIWIYLYLTKTNWNMPTIGHLHGPQTQTNTFEIQENSVKRFLI